METKIIAMWSGPRNLSTAMMRSFGARRDCVAVDEPFYAAYLHATGLKHPMHAEIISDGEIDPFIVAHQCGSMNDKPVIYQKHMCHHMVEEFPLDWLDNVINVFLIRDPARVLSSYAVKAENVTAMDIGFRQQRTLFDCALKRAGQRPIILDASDIRANPDRMLQALCETIGISFDPAMLSWQAGPKPEDGIWAKHWYDAVWQSTGFAPAETTPIPVLPEALATINREVRADYDYMRGFRLMI